MRKTKDDKVTSVNPDTKLDTTTEGAAIHHTETVDMEATDVAQAPLPDTTTATASGRAKSKKKPDSESVQAVIEPDVRILKVSKCPSLSNRSTLTYHVGCSGNRILLRVFHNTGEGCFNPEWVAYHSVKDVLTSNTSITAAALRSIFEGKSVNTAGFVLAMLKDLGLIETSKANLRCYSYTDAKPFEQEVAELIASDVSIAVPELPRKKGQTSAKRLSKT